MTPRFDSSFSTVSARAYASACQKAASYRDILRSVVNACSYSAPESSLCLPSDAVAWGLSSEIIQTVRGRDGVRHVALVGIGGSSRGVEAVVQALTPPGSLRVFDTFSREGIDTWIASLQSDRISLGDIAICIVSKSGTTAETISNANYLMAHLVHLYGNGVWGRCIVSTDEHSPLTHIASEHSAHVVHTPTLVGGRYSVMGSGAIVPLGLLGVDISMLHKGAQTAIDELFVEEAPSVNSACVMALWYKQGIIVHDTFVQNPRLSAYGAWYRQLLAESIGKESKHGGVGFFPTVSVGTSDLHSVFQCVMSNPARIATHMVLCAQGFSALGDERGGICSAEALPSEQDQYRAIMRGVIESYHERGAPLVVTTIDTLDAFSLGYLMQARMIETMVLGHLLGVNAFDQLMVELYKQKARAFLK